jgi:small subunit ribosomal protein S2
LEKTVEALERASKMLSGVASRGGKILFLGTKAQTAPYVKEAADACGMPYVNGRWLGGTLTNFSEIHKLIKRLRDLKRRKETGDLRKYTKREQLMFDREIDELEVKIGGIAMLDEVPSVVVVFDVRNEMTAVREATRQGIPIIALTDSNINPKKVTLAIPSNDDAIKAIALMASFISDSVKEGRKNVQEKKKAPVKRKIAIK